MATRLLLVRHGKAEDHGVRPDFDRALIPEGIRALKKMAPKLAERLAEQETVVITSPLVRARETAEILCDSMGAPMEVESWVSDGVFSKVLETRTRKETTIILVGHNPTFDEWHTLITGEYLHFKKGAVSSYLWEKEETLPVHEWMRTAKELAKGE